MPNTATLERPEQEPAAPSWKPNPAINPPLERMLNPQVGDRIISTSSTISDLEVFSVSEGLVRLSNGFFQPRDQWEKAIYDTIAPTEHRGERTYVPVEGYTYDRFMDPQPGDQIVRTSNGVAWITVVGRSDDGGVRYRFGEETPIYTDTLLEWRVKCFGLENRFPNMRFVPVHQVDAPAPVVEEPSPTISSLREGTTHYRLSPDEVAAYEVRVGDILMYNNAPWREVVSIQNDRVSQRFYEGETLHNYDSVNGFNTLGRRDCTHAEMYHILRLKPRSEAKFSTLKFAGSLVALLKELATDCPCCRAVLKGFNQRDIRTSRLLNPDMPGNYFAFRENEGQVTLCPKGKEQEINADGSWSRKNRQGLKPAKWLRSMLHPKLAKRIPDHVFAKFSERFKASEEAHRVAFKFTDFDDAYNESKYDGNIASCMWDKSVENFYGYFDCQVLVASRHGKYVGRAIVWNKVYGLDMPFMDRVYASSPEITELFLSHAKTNGWAHKKQQSNQNMKGFILPDGSETSKSVFVAPNNNGVHHCEFFPYLDTFRRMDSDGDCHNDDNDDCGGWILNDTSGGREECEEEDNHDGEVCDIDGEWIREEDAVYVGGDWYSVHDDRIVMCHRSEEIILRSEAYEVEISRRETIFIHEDYVSRA